jgi:hypothetical protein
MPSAEQAETSETMLHLAERRRAMDTEALLRSRQRMQSAPDCSRTFGAAETVSTWSVQARERAPRSGPSIHSVYGQFYGRAQDRLQAPQQQFATLGMM